MKTYLHVLKRIFFIFFFILSLFLLQSKAFALTPISNVQQLQAMNNDLSEDYYLTGDIDCSSILYFVPIGSQYAPFFGTFDGRGYQIKNLQVGVDGSQSYYGLFGKTFSAAIQNVELICPEVKGLDYVGSLAGYAENTTFTKCFVSGRGEIDCKGGWVGGLIGYAKNCTLEESCFSGKVSVYKDNAGGLIGEVVDSNIRNCYRSGMRTSWAKPVIYDKQPGDNFGGLIGKNQGSILENCYIMGEVSSNEFGGPELGWLVGSNLGAVVGLNVGGTYQNNFYCLESAFYLPGTGSGDIGGITGKTKKDFLNQSTFTGWDFTNIWNMQDIPRLKTRSWINISTLQELQDINNDLDSWYRLVNDIDATDTAIWNSGAGFQPLGTGTLLGFTGRFDGQGYTIRNLTINRQEIKQTNIGLFARTSYAFIENINLENIYYSGFIRNGGLAGNSRFTTIKNCTATGTVTGSERLAGLVAELEESVVLDCYAIVNVKYNPSEGQSSSGDNSGGFIGIIDCSYVDSCWASGNIAIPDGAALGGFAGRILWTSVVKNCYAVGNVIGESKLGGFVGEILFNYSPETDLLIKAAVSESFSLGDVSGKDKMIIGGFVGIHRGLIEDCYSCGKVKVGSLGVSGGFAGYSQAYISADSSMIGWDPYPDAILRRCYAIGLADNSMGGYMGGFLGSGGGIIENNYWDYQTESLPQSQDRSDGDLAGVEGRTTADMQQQATFAGWDFTNIWTMVDYPHLQFESGLIIIETASDLSDSSEGVAYSHTFTVRGGTAPYAWALISGTLPNGLNLSSAGVLSGTVSGISQIENHEFVVSVTDAGGNIGGKVFSIIAIPEEEITFSEPPIGEDNPDVNKQYVYTTKEAVNNLGHEIEYRFNWGDGTYSSWSGSISAAKTWVFGGNYEVRAEARCKTHTSIVGVSEPLAVAIEGSLQVPVIQNINRVFNDTEYEIVWNIIPGANIYELVEDDNEDFSSPTRTFWVEGNSFIVQPPEFNKKYYYKVRAWTKQPE